MPAGRHSLRRPFLSSWEGGLPRQLSNPAHRGGQASNPAPLSAAPAPKQGTPPEAQADSGPRAFHPELTTTPPAALPALGGRRTRRPNQQVTPDLHPADHRGQPAPRPGLADWSRKESPAPPPQQSSLASALGRGFPLFVCPSTRPSLLFVFHICSPKLLINR